MKTSKNQVKMVLFLIVLIMTTVMLWNNQGVRDRQLQLARKQLLQEAISHYDTMIDTREWNARYGGVYVKPIEGFKPNPYLKDNTLMSHEGEQLFLINHAWMTRQISEISNRKRQYYFRITSLNPLNPDNQADAFEQEALRYLQTRKNENFYYRFNEDKQEFNFMGKLIVAESCLQCHAEQGYKVGDLRGGIRISIPGTVYQQEVELLQSESLKTNITIIVFSIVIIVFFIWFVDVIYGRKEEKERLKLLDDMAKRIKELQCMYDITEAIRQYTRMDELLTAVVKIIPSGWHYSECARARIILDDKEYVSEAFELSDWKQSSELILQDSYRGVVEVYYTESFPELDEGPFQIQERKLINSIAKTLSETIELKYAEIKLRHMATHDILTGLYNRKIFEQKIIHELTRSARYDHSLSVFMLDIDHFKEVNDTYGHQVGDTVLQSFAGLAEHAIRKTDDIARYGGEEFIIILPETVLTEAEELAERLRRQVAELVITIEDGRTIGITVSIGVANFPQHARTWQELVNAADQAMYAAKQAGRNQVKTAIDYVMADKSGG